MNRAKLKFTKLITTTSRVSVRNRNESEREGAKQIAKRMKSVTRGFVLPRFGSCKPTPCWGGHKDRVSCNPFPLSNGPSDRVRFSSQSLGTQSSHKDHHKIGVSCLNYKWVWSQWKNQERRKQSKRKSSKEHDKSLSLVTKALCGIGEDLISLVCLELNARALVSSWSGKTWMTWMWGGWGYL